MGRIAAMTSTLCFVLSRVVIGAFVAQPAAALAPLHVEEANVTHDSPASSAPRYRWTRKDGAARRDAGGVIALADHAGVLASATAQHATVVYANATRRVALDDIRDLAFDDAGRLFVATGRGLWLLEGSETTAPRDISPAPGEAARRVHRVVCEERWIAIATDAGAYVARKGRGAPRFVSLNGKFPVGPVRDLAIADDALIAVVGSSLWRAELGGEGVPFAVRELLLPSRIDGEGTLSLTARLPADALVLATGSALYLRADTGADSGGSAQWTSLRPVLPPGARIRRVGAFEAGYWLATDRGLLLARTLAGPWRRAAAPAGRAVAAEVIERDGKLLLASSIGLLVGEAREHGAALESADSGGSQVARAMAPPPSIRAVHRVALREQGLEARVVHEAWQGVRRRAWLPVVGLSFDVDRGRSRAKDRDESFVSGGYHTLHDLDRDRSLDLAAGVSFTWDLRDVAFEPEQIDLSREARLVIGLRDDVLDEVNQLYFERLSVASQLVQAMSDRGGDGKDVAAPGALRIRLHELTAGLDAWTGGWFSEQLEREVPALE
ncbi:MAG: hypothetical protein QF570_21465 [Myxococcota bacterium]|jgi:hypothetical protein|nr:hypothetical protein [Myxococcota bacterium]